MERNEATVVLLREAIMHYLASHLHAADTLEGIAEWWLPEVTPRPTAEDLHAALDVLVSEGKMVRTELVDGTTLYAATCAPAGSGRRH